MMNTNSVLSQLPILYSFRRCPYAMRARMAIAYSQTPVELREVLLKDKPQSMLDISPKGTVPVLKLDNQVIDESKDVMFWALKTYDPENWYCGLSALQKSEIGQLIDTNDNHFKPILDKYKYAIRFPEHSEDDYFQLALPFLSQLNQRLENTQYLINDKISLADVAVFPFIRQFAFVNKAKFDSLALNKLLQWLNAWLKSELFVAVMKKHQPWKVEHKRLLLTD